MTITESTAIYTLGAEIARHGLNCGTAIALHIYGKVGPASLATLQDVPTLNCARTCFCLYRRALDAGKLEAN